MEKKIKVGAVSYLNTKPLLHGIHKSGLIDSIELVEAYPSIIAGWLVDGTIDIGLVPVAIIPKLKESHIVTDYCIGAEGAVATVCLFSEVPIEQIETVLLDYQSRTSVNLLKVLMKEHWKKDVLLVDAKEGYQHQIKGTTAGVVIGDRAFEQRLISTYVYDLAEAWINFTGLPFVFAAWIANKTLPESFIEEFNKANALGIAHINEVIAEQNYKHYNLKTYYTQNISYALTAEKRKGLALFLEKLKRIL
ncbi:menaquinone biosynthetic enzyme MqnA/MqnD family protein [Parasediminibacterium sp. JCM 36343]|uniref:menaquinone biosynthetic enzyme MqnA/MqnD family protein n=1 Tax=Parasediminibacterium sp. JCM 36343 TaxID=3374279 RepID=UPI00397BF04C